MVVDVGCGAGEKVDCETHHNEVRREINRNSPTASSSSIWSSMSSAKNKDDQPPLRNASKPLTVPSPLNPQHATLAHVSTSALRGVRGVDASRPWP